MRAGLDAPMAAGPSTVEYALKDMALDADGVRDFFWPIEPGELSSLRDELVRRMMPVLAADKALLPLYLASNHLIRHLMAVWQAAALRRRLEDAGLHAHVPTKAALWRAVMEDREPPLPQLVSDLAACERTKASRLYYKGLGRAAEAGAFLLGRYPYRDHLSFRPYTRRLSRESIIATQPSEILAYHARALGEPVYFVRIEQWFRPVRHAIRPAYAETEPVIALANAPFREMGVDLTESLERHLRTFAGMLHGLIAWHLEQLRAKPDRLPRRLWTGTGGNLWSRILRQAVREAGGTAVGHDHSIGSGYKTSISMGLVEFVACDRFVTANEARVRALSLSAERSPLTCIPAPEIVALPYRAVAAARVPRTRISAHGNRLMYLSTIYCGDTMHMDPHVPDIVAVDWQARLFAALHEEGWHILHKPHPESRTPPPASLTRQFGIHTLGGYFEDVIGEADIFLFDKVNSTAFSHALALGLPIVYVEVDDWDWIPEAWEALGRRVAVVKTSRDDRGRIIFDRSALQEAITRAPSLTKDNCFYKTYVA